MIYIGYLSLFFFATFLDFETKQRELKRAVQIILVTISICFIGLRYYTGADWSGYINYFSTVTWDDSRYQFGYKLLNILCKMVVDDYHLVQFISTTFFFISVVIFFNKHSKYPFLCLFLFVAFYFSTLLMAQVRQSLAISVLLLGSNYLFEKRLLRWSIIVFLASLFHFTAMIALSFPLLRIQLTKKTRFLLCLLPIAIWIVPQILFAILEIISYIPGKFGSIVVTYLNSNQFNKAAEVSTGLVFFSKLLFSVFIVLLYSPKTTKENIFLNSLLVSTVLKSCVIVFTMFERLESYFGLYAIIGWIYFFEIKKIKKEKQLFFIILFFFLLFFLLPFVKDRMSTGISQLTGRSSQYHYIPYYNVFLHPADASQRKDWSQ